MAVIDQYFKYLVEAGGSDLHLSEGQPPKVRVNGTISAISDENLEGQAFKNLLAEICDPQAALFGDEGCDGAWGGAGAVPQNHRGNVQQVT